jgi:hypothetical protein
MNPTKCIGIMGWLFGHKFSKAFWDGADHCWRCGMPRGGWKS